MSNESAAEAALVAERWAAEFRDMKVGDTIEVSDCDYHEATNHMSAGYEGRQKSQAGGNVRCTITRKRGTDR